MPEVPSDRISESGPIRYRAMYLSQNRVMSLAFHTGIWHGAFGGNTKRRMGTIQYYENPQTVDSFEEIRRVLRHVHKNEIETHGRPWFPEYWRSLDNPRHKAWVRRLDEISALDEIHG